MNFNQARLIANRHFDLCPPLTESEVVAFEVAHKVTLPEEYREFLINAGNGGEARHSLRNLFPLGEESEYKGILALLDRPFPHTNTYQLQKLSVSEIRGTLPLLH